MVKATGFGWIAAALALNALAYGQGRGEPGKQIGSIAVRANLIVMTLNKDVLGKESRFDLSHHTLRFTPAESQYRVENVAWIWDSVYLFTGGSAAWSHKRKPPRNAFALSPARQP